MLLVIDFTGVCRWSIGIKRWIKMNENWGFVNIFCFFSISGIIIILSDYAIREAAALPIMSSKEGSQCLTE